MSEGGHEIEPLKMGFQNSYYHQHKFGNRCITASELMIKAENKWQEGQLQVAMHCIANCHFFYLYIFCSS